MAEIIAVEYREDQWKSAAALANRVGAVADACADQGLVALGLEHLRNRWPITSLGGGSALVFGLRARSLEAVVTVANAIGLRGYTGFFTVLAKAGFDSSALDARDLEGLGMVWAFGGDQIVVDASPDRVRRLLDGTEGVWMPAPNEKGRAVDGLFLDEAARRSVDWIWVPGGGVNRGVEEMEAAVPRVLRARLDDGTTGVEEMARWARGDRLYRGRARVADLAASSRQWLCQIGSGG